MKKQTSAISKFKSQAIDNKQLKAIKGGTMGDPPPWGTENRVMGDPPPWGTEH